MVIRQDKSLPKEMNMIAQQRHLLMDCATCIALVMPFAVTHASTPLIDDNVDIDGTWPEGGFARPNDVGPASLVRTGTLPKPFPFAKQAAELAQAGPAVQTTALPQDSPTKPVSNERLILPRKPAGDGDNVWPFIHRDDKLHYDCSKLDQWATVFQHGTHKGMYLHFKMQVGL